MPHPEDWMALVAAADGVIGADTAPTHLSIMLNKPTLAVFGAIPSHLRIPERFRNADWLTVLDIETGQAMSVPSKPSVLPSDAAATLFRFDCND
jgi:hypothetical protein